MDRHDGSGVLQIECIVTLWLRNEAATPTTPSGRRDRAVCVRGSPQIGSNVSEPPNVTQLLESGGSLTFEGLTNI